MAHRRAIWVGALALLVGTACENRTVVPVEVASVEVDPSDLSLVEGESRTARAVPLGPGGEQLTGRTASWATDAASVATVDSDGKVEAVLAGETTVRATVEGVVGTASVTVLEGPSVSLSESAAKLAAVVGRDSDEHVVDVTNRGHGVLSGLSTSLAYRSGDPTGWLTAGLSGTTAPASLTLAASAAALTTGTYRATVTVASPSNGGSSAKVTVDLEVQPPPPTIVLDVDGVSFSGVVGGQVPAVQEVAVTNGGNGTLSGLSAAVTYQGSAAGWLSVALSRTTAPATLTLRASVGLLPAGSYSASVDVISAVASNSPQSLTVTFNVAPVSVPPRPGQGSPTRPAPSTDPGEARP